MADIPAMLGEAQRAKRALDAFLLAANVTDLGEARVAATLCLTIGEQFGAALHLFEGGFSSHAPILIRSMLEALADLRNLVNDPNYVDQIRFDDARSNVALFSDYAKVDGMTAESLKTLKLWGDKAQPVVDELKAKGLSKLNAIEKFKLAGMAENYVSYRVLCSFSHGQLTTLLSRHAGKFELSYHRAAPEQTTKSMIAMALAIFCQAVEQLPKFSDSRDAQLRAQLDAIDTAWTKLNA
jgi:hypothetical protein